MLRRTLALALLSALAFAGITSQQLMAIAAERDGRTDRFPIAAGRQAVDSGLIVIADSVVFNSGRKPASAGTRNVQVTGRGGVPTAATSVLVRITASNAARNGKVTIYTTGTKRPAGATLTVTKAPERSNYKASTLALVKPSAGKIAVHTNTPARLSLAIVSYTFGASAATGQLSAVAAVRRIDTANRIGGRNLPKGAMRTFPVTGVGGIPSTMVSAVAAQITTSGTRAGSLTTVGGAVIASVGKTAATAFALLPVDASGRVQLSSSVADTRVRLDVTGWVAGEGVPALATYGYVALGGGRLTASPTTVATRSTQFATLGRAGLPGTAASALLARVTYTGSRKSTELRTYVGGSRARTGMPLDKGSGSGVVALPVDASGDIALSLGAGRARVRIQVLGYVTRPLVDTTPMPTPTTPTPTPTTPTPTTPTPTPTLDSTPPNLVVTTPTNDAEHDVTNDGALTVTGTVDDIETGVDRVQVSLDGRLAGDAIIDRSAVPNFYSFELTPTEGAYAVTVTAFDRAGNRSDVTRTVTVRVSAPSVPHEDLAAPSVLKLISENVTSATSEALTVTGMIPGIEPNNVLIVDPTAATPSGALRRVVSVSIVGDATVLRTVPAKLVEAFTEVHLDQTVALADAASAQASATTLDSVPIASVASAQASGTDSDAVAAAAVRTWETRMSHAAEACFDVADKPIECDSTEEFSRVEGNVSATLFASLSLHLYIDYSPEDWHSLPTLNRFEAEIIGTAASTANATIAGKMAAETETIEVAGPHIPPARFIIGGYPVWVDPEVTFAGSAAWETSAELSWNCEVVGHAALGAEYARDTGWDNLDSFDVDLGCGPPAAQMSTTVSVIGSAELHLAIYGLAGPTMNLDLSPSLTGHVSTTTTPAFRGDMNVAAGLGVYAEAFGFPLVDKSIPNLVSRDFELFSLGGELRRNPLDGAPEEVALDYPYTDVNVDFDVTATVSHVSIHLGGAPADTTLIILDEDGNEVESDWTYQGRAEVLLRDLVPGRYTAKVRNDSGRTGDATLWFTTPTSYTATVNEGKTAIDIDRPGRRTHTSFVLTAGDRASVTIGQHTGTFFDTTMAIVDPDGQVVAATRNDYDPVVTSLFTAPKSGTYTAYFYGDDSNPIVTTADVYVSLAKDTTVTRGLPVQLLTDRPGQEARATFAATAGERIDLAMTDATGGDFNAELYLYDPTNDRVALSTFVNEAAMIKATATETGTYTAILRHPRLRTGTAQLHLSSPNIAFGAIGGEPVPVTIQYPGQESYVEFDVADGERVNVALTGDTLSDYRYDLDVFAPDGRRVDWGSFTGGGANAAFTAPMAGKYRAVLASDYAMTGSGIIVLTNPAEYSITLDGASVPVDVDRPGREARAFFGVEAGQRINVALTIASALADTRLTVYDPSGGVVGTTHYSQGMARLRFTATKSGDYIAVASIDHAGTGTATLLVSTAVEASTSIDGGPVSVDINRPGQEMVISFDSSMGREVHLALDSNGGSDWSVVVASPAGSTLSSGITYQGQKAFAFTSTASGTHRITISSSKPVTLAGTLTLTSAAAAS